MRWLLILIILYLNYKFFQVKSANVEFLDKKVYLSLYKKSYIRIAEKVELFKISPFVAIDSSSEADDFEYLDSVNISKSDNRYSIKIGESYLCGDIFSKKIYRCLDNELNFWEIEESKSTFKILRYNLCLTLNEELILSECSESNDNQKFNIENIDADSSCICKKIERIFKFSREIKPNEYQNFKRNLENIKMEDPKKIKGIEKIEIKIKAKYDFNAAIAPYKKIMDNKPKVKDFLEKLHKLEKEGLKKHKFKFKNLKKLFC